MERLNKILKVIWNNVQSIASVFAILITIFLANQSARQNKESLVKSELLITKQITIEQINIKRKEFNDAYNSIIYTIESSDKNIKELFRNYIQHTENPKEQVQSVTLSLRDLLYEVDDLSFDMLNENYNLEVALPILSGVFAKIEAGISTLEYEEIKKIRKGMPNYSYLSLNYFIPILDKKIKKLEIYEKYLDSVNYGYSLKINSSSVFLETHDSMDKMRTIQNSISKGFNLNEQDDSGNTLTMYTASEGNLELLEELSKKYQIDLNIKNNNGANALMLAVKGGHYEVCKELVTLGIDINSQSNKGFTALMSAARNGYTKIVELLVLGGANLDLMSEENETALIFASHKGHLKIVDILLKNKAGLKFKTTHGMDALLIATTNGHHPVVNLLLSFNADPNSRTDKKETALMFATLGQFENIVELLIKYGADPNVSRNDGVTALMQAGFRGDVEIAQLLVENDALINVKDIYATPLHYAVLGGNAEVVKLFLEHGANTQVKTEKDFKSAKELARDKGYSEIIELLENQ